MKMLAEILLLLCAATSVEGIDGRTVLLWVFRHDNNTQEWQEMVNQISAHKENLTHISMCTHRIQNNGTFGFQSANGVPYGLAMEHWGQVIAQQGFVMTPLIDVDYKSWQDIYQFMGDDQKVEKFISDAIAKAKQNGYQGYNMDIEFNDTPSSFGVRYTAFLNKFADALHQHNMTLTDAIAGYCPPWFDGETCAMLASSHLDKLFTMNTYQEGADKFEEYIKASAKTFGAKNAIGMSNSQDPVNLHSQAAMNFAVQNNVKDLALWVLAGPYAADTTIWADLGYFLHYAH